MSSATPSRRVDAQTPDRLTRVERLILFSATIILAVLAASFFLGAVTLRQDYLAQERENLRRLTLTLSEQTARAFQEVDIILRETLPLLTAEDMAARDDRLHRLLRNRIAGLPQSQALLVFGPDGTMIGHSREYPTPAVNAADRDYFLAQVAGSGDLFISAPKPNRVNGKWMISLSRRIGGPGGALAGVVMAAVDMEYFNRLYRSLNLPADTKIDLCRADGLILATHPFDEARLGAALCAPEQSASTIISRSEVPGLPLAVRLTEPLETALANWRKAILALGLGLLAASAGAGLGLNMAWGAEQLGKKQRENERLREDIERITRHDLKAPLVSMFEGCRLLLDTGEASTQQADILRHMQGEVRRMLNLIGAYFTILNMENKKFQLQPSPVDLVQVVKRVWRELEQGAQAKDVRLDLRFAGEPCPEGARCIVPAEESLIHTMLANLARNAIEASPPGGTVTVDIDCRAQAMIAIANAGSVPPHIRERFFEKYVTAGKRDGTGLGTYSAKLIVESHGGTISLNASIADRTTVVVSLPTA